MRWKWRSRKLHNGLLKPDDLSRVTLSITTLDEKLQRVMEPRASTSARRLEAIRTLAEAGEHCIP